MEEEKTLEQYQEEHNKYDTHDLDHWLYWEPSFWPYIEKEFPEHKRQYLKFRKEDEEKVRPTLKELAIRKDLEKYNPFMTGQEKSINQSKMDDLIRRIKNYEIK